MATAFGETGPTIAPWTPPPSRAVVDPRVRLDDPGVLVPQPHLVLPRDAELAGVVVGCAPRGRGSDRLPGNDRDGYRVRGWVAVELVRGSRAGGRRRHVRYLGHLAVRRHAADAGGVRGALGRSAAPAPRVPAAPGERPLGDRRAALVGVGFADPSSPQVAARRSLLLPTVTVVLVLVVIAAVWFVFEGGSGSFPKEAAGFRLVRSSTVDAYNPIGPPVFDRSNLRVVRIRDAIYVDARRSYEVRIVEDDLTSQFPHDVLLQASGVGIVTSPAFPEGRLGQVTAAMIDGVRYTCVRTKVATGCIWTEPSLTGWTMGDGGVRLDRLRKLAGAIHDAVA